MNIFFILKIKAIILFLIACANLILALLIWSKDKTRATFHLGLMALFSFLFAIVLAGLYFFWGPDSPNKIDLLIMKSTWIGILILPSFITFLYYLRGTKHLRAKSFILYSLGVLILLLVFTTDLIVKGAGYLRVGIFREEEIGPLDPIGRLYVLFCIIILFWNLFKYYFQTSSLERLRVRYFILGSSVYAFGGIISASLIPLFFKMSGYVEITSYFSFIWVLLTAYAIFRYRLLDIRITLSRVIVYLFTFFTVIGTGILLAYLNILLNTPLPLSFVVSFIALLSILLFQLHKSYEKLTAKYFYPAFYNTKMTIAELEERLTQVLELDVFSLLIINTLKETFKLDKVAILTREIGKKGYIIQKIFNFEKKELNSLLKESFFISYFEKIKKPLVKEEIEDIIERNKKEENKQRLKEVKDKINSLGVEVFLPLIFKKKVIGIIILGNKKSGEAFSSQDLDLLATLSYQASIALKNASLFAEVNRRRKELEAFYRLIVGRELKMRELEKKIKELEEKLKEKDAK